MEKKTKKGLLWFMLVNFLTALITGGIIARMDGRKSIASLAIFVAVYMIASAAVIILVGLYRKFVLKRTFFTNYLL